MPLLRLPKHPPSPPRQRPLTPAQEIFAQHVSNGMPATDAFLRAWPHAVRWNRRKVRTQADRLRRSHAGIGTRIEKLLRQRLENLATSRF